MAGVSIVGSGNVGANTAFFIAETCNVGVTLIDAAEGRSTGKALDMMEAAPLRKYGAQLRGADSIEAIKDSEVVIVAIGSVRKPGSERDSLYGENAESVAGVARDVARLAPKSVVIVMTEPVDALTTLFVKESKLPRSRVIGLGAALDSARMRQAVASTLSLSSENVSALVIGAHSKEMVALPSYSRISGVPLPQLMSKAQIDHVVSEVRASGDEIVRLAGRASSYYAPGAVAAELVNAIVNDLNRVLSVSLVLDGEYGIRGTALSLPAVIGRSGVVKVLEPKLEADEERRLVASAKTVQATIASGGKK